MLDSFDVSSTARRLHHTYSEYLALEVTSPSTEDYDRGEKLRHNKMLASIREILIVSHREPHLELHGRVEGDWTLRSAARGETLTLESVAAQIAVDDVYRGGLEDSA